VSLRCAAVGSLAAAILLELLRRSFGLYVGLLTNPSAVYGRFAFVLFFAISIEVTWTIVLYGSEMSYCAQHFGALARGAGPERHLQGRWIGLAASVALASRLSEGSPMTGQEELADRLLVPPDQLEPILKPLLEAGILRATEGRERDYLLAQPPHRVSVEQVLTAYEVRNRRIFEPLGDGLQQRLEDLAARVERQRSLGLDGVTLAGLVEREDEVAEGRPAAG
jgi:DNA-binding IscR family transcriptional regulator